MTKEPPIVVPSAEGGAGTGTVSRALALLTLLADAGGTVSVKHVGDVMQVPPSTAHRMLQLLRKEGFVDAVAGGQYGIGPQFYRVAARVMAGKSPVAMAQPVIEAIAEAFNETVLFGLYLPTEGAMSFAARADGQQKLKYQIDMHTPLSVVWGASGKSVLAFLPPEEASRILAAEGPSPVTGAMPPDAARLAVELEQVRVRGWAMSESEKLPDARGIAAPVFGPTGVIGCICLTSPKARMPHSSTDAIGVEVSKRAKALSHDLGADFK
ncbi:IclR family transcriptional regulator [Variovorax rhizosphaerae]|uniref:IclR family transcriptional regulator n=1 Tax=Variovorax rhizosphaerae TaxID=1836200 RepID=A0ABU8WF48_9BURK